MWSKQALQELAREKFRDYKLIVVSNREPYIHQYQGGRIECLQPASGMATALDPLMRACGGVWVAHGSGDADRHAPGAMGRTPVPPEAPLYMLRRVWLSKELENGYYYGLANGGLWPLCHVAFRRPVFHREHWEAYRRVNEIFAQAVLEEAGDDPAFVFIQDYHLGLLPRLLKNGNPSLVVAQFWHIPWPNRETFRAFPWKEDFLDGLLGNDLLGFHLRYHCQNFLDTVDRAIEARVDQERYEVTLRGKVTAVRPFPISIDFAEHASTAAGAAVDNEMEHWRRALDLGQMRIGLGIDRIDYTKGIPERLRSLDLFLERCPEHRGRLVFVQIGVPSRLRVAEYKRLGEEIEALVSEINTKWSSGAWRPILFLKTHLGPAQMMALHRLADFCMVSSLHDGMNLVAKEYVASRFDENGMLILSEFTGAARELTDAILVNPFDLDTCADAIRRALELPPEERRRRMRRMRAVVADNNVYRWAAKILAALARIEAPQPRPPRMDAAARQNGGQLCAGVATSARPACT